MKEIFIDTNIFLRFLTADDPEKAKQCKKLFQKAEKKEVFLISNLLVIAELIWTLRSFYQYPEDKVIEKIEGLLTIDGLKIENVNILKEAIKIWEETNLKFIDAYNVAYLKEKKIEKIYTYDRGLKKLGLKVLEP